MAVELGPSERVLWTGSPVRHPVFEPADWFLTAFGVLWLAVVGRGGLFLTGPSAVM